MPSKKNKNKGKVPGETGGGDQQQERPRTDSQQSQNQPQPGQDRPRTQQQEQPRPQRQQQQQQDQPRSNPQPSQQRRQQPQQSGYQGGGEPHQAAVPPGFPAWGQKSQSGGPKQQQKSQSQAALPPGAPGWGPPAKQQQPMQKPQAAAPPGFPGWGAPQQIAEKKQPPPKQQQQARLEEPSTSMQTAVPELTQKMERVQMSPTRALKMIESDPNITKYEGTRGRRVNLEVNYLKIAINKLVNTAYHYDVEFTPDVPKKMLPVALDEFMKKFFPGVHFAFDGRKNFYTYALLKVKGVTLDGSLEQEVEAVLRDRRKNFKVKVQFAAEVDLSVLRSYTNPQFQHNDRPSRAIQCLDIILRTAFKPLMASNKAVAAARALYFVPQGRPDDLGDQMELWYGLFQSAILGRQSLYLNVDVAHKAFPSEVPVLDILANFNRGSIPTGELQSWQKDQLHAHLNMLTVAYRVNNNEQYKTFGYNGLVESARKAMFVDSNGKTMSVLEYFQREKKVQLRFPDLPCMHVGSRVRNVYLPMELCIIPAGQATNKKCTPNCVAKMIRFSATSTDVRKKKIMDLLSKINYGDGNGAINGFGIGIDKKFTDLDGRVIDAPKIKYINKVVAPRNGVWNGEKYLKAGDPVKWAVINCDDRTQFQAVQQLQRNIMSESQRLGMNLTPTSGDADYCMINMMRAKPGELGNKLADFKKKGYQLVIVIIIDRNDCYARVKQAAELEVGIMTQCIKSNTIYRMGNGNPMMTIGNILLKVNAKLNGTNHAVQEPSYQATLGGGVMFVGADVTHPSPEQRDIPSVVGVAASYDDIGFRYQCAWRLQDPKKEMIVDLQAILTSHLQFYQKKNNNKLPAKIMYYRDGVSEGQFAEVLEIEMTAISGAMKAVYKQATPAKVTFVVVQKRHHTRFFPKDKDASDGGRNNNILAGTVVDKNIVHPFQFQFFMASHAAIQGVTKPTKYCVLVNESKISADDLQAITYDLCHLFTRCNRSVSYPAPTYYAHLVAARGKSYIIGARLNMQNLQHEYDKRVIRPEFLNNTPMFFV